MSNKIIKICKALGNNYSIKKIDNENVIYRKLNENYDIEISGIDNSSSHLRIVVFVWDLKTKKVINSYSEIDSLERLQSVLHRIENTY